MGTDEARGAERRDFTAKASISREVAGGGGVEGVVGQGVWRKALAAAQGVAVRGHIAAPLPIRRHVTSDVKRRAD